MYKNVSLRPRSVDGRSTWRLIGPDGLPVDAFTAFAESIRNLATNTIESYCRHVAEFVDYMIEATKVLGGQGVLTKVQLVDAVKAYRHFLMLGLDASDETAKSIAKSLPPGTNSPTSLTPKIAAVRRFLRLSEQVRRELVERASLEGSIDMVAGEPLLPEIGEKRALTPFEIRSMQARSMLAGVIAGGPKFIDELPLRGAGRASSYDSRRAFPHDKVMDLIDAMPTHRDAALYALHAASGGRGHEILQTLLEDLDVADGTVRLVDPMNREGHRSYRALAPTERERLAWKGRTTDLTLLIEPFAGKFFQELELYLAKEYVDHGRHSFVFQYSSGEHRGWPYFLSADSSRLAIFHAACKRVGVTLPARTGPHSLRHMYGTYVLNYFPRPNGDYGLPLAVVQQLLGHADAKQTLRYARYDEDLIKLELQHANRVLFQYGVHKSVLQLKAEALEKQLADVRALMNDQELADD